MSQTSLNGRRNRRPHRFENASAERRCRVADSDYGRGALGVFSDADRLERTGGLPRVGGGVFDPVGDHVQRRLREVAGEYERRQ